MLDIYWAGKASVMSIRIYSPCTCYIKLWSNYGRCMEMSSDETECMVLRYRSSIGYPRRSVYSYGQTGTTLAFPVIMRWKCEFKSAQYTQIHKNAYELIICHQYSKIHNNSIMHYIDAEKYNKYMIRIRLKRFLIKNIHIHAPIQTSKRNLF